MTYDNIKVISLVGLILLLSIIGYQFSSAAKKSAELENKDYKIRQLEQQVQEAQSLYGQAQDELRGCQVNLNICRGNNWNLEEEARRRRTRDFFNGN